MYRESCSRYCSGLAPKVSGAETPEHAAGGAVLLLYLDKYRAGAPDGHPGETRNLLNEGLEQSLAKAFAGRVHPVEIARKLELEATARKRVALIGELIPDEYLVELAASDFAELEPIQAGLEEQLAEYVTEMADREGLFLLSSPRVTLTASEALRLGQFRPAQLLGQATRLYTETRDWPRQWICLLLRAGEGRCGPRVGL